METALERNTADYQDKMTPKMVREILKAENQEIEALCREVKLVPKKDNNGNTYFSKKDVNVLTKLKNLHSLAVAAKTNKNQTKPMATVAVNQDNTAVIKAFKEVEKNISLNISKILDEKLDGIDEVVVELVRCKTENETLKQKINQLNKEIYELKNENSSFVNIAFNIYKKKDNFKLF